MDTSLDPAPPIAAPGARRTTDPGDWLPVRTVHRAVVDVLRQRIIRAELRPGDRLLQDELAAALRVSRTPVREALRQLEAEGLVVTVPHRGAEVARLDPHDVEEIYSLRAVNEGFAVRRSAERLSEDQLTRLEAIVADMQAASAAGDHARLVDLNRSFHALLYAAADHRRLIQLVRDLHLHSERYRYAHMDMAQQHFRDTTREHQAILEACRRRDAAAAEALVQEHLGRTAAALIVELRQPQGTASGDGRG